MQLLQWTSGAAWHGMANGRMSTTAFVKAGARASFVLSAMLAITVPAHALTNKSNFAALSASMSSAARDRDFRVSYSVGTVLGSLNIVNTVGSYGMQNLAGFPR